MRSIDIHAHLTPQCFWRATESGGNWHSIRREQDARGQQCAIVGGKRQILPPRARWTPEERLADMDSLGVDIQVVSPYVGFYNYHLEAGSAAATSRALNDEIAEMTRAWPERFAGLGTLPMQDVKGAIAELERAMTTLKLKGVEINDHVNGKTLDEPEYRPFWKAAEQLGALVFFHQGGETLVSPRSTRYHLPNTIGNLVDRAVTFATLVSGGVMDDCPISRSAWGTAAATRATESAVSTEGGRRAQRRACTSRSLPARISAASTTTASCTRSPPCASSSIRWASIGSYSGPTGRTTWRSTGRSRGFSRWSRCHRRRKRPSCGGICRRC